MQTYKEFRPTQFDSKGLCGESRGISEFLVVPVKQTRDSGPFEQSNFAVALKLLGGESDTVQVHRFRHWGPGWFEIVLVNPTDAKRVKVAEEIEYSLADYPILDEDDLSNREWEAINQY